MTSNREDTNDILQDVFYELVEANRRLGFDADAVFQQHTDECAVASFRAVGIKLRAVLHLEFNGGAIEHGARDLTTFNGADEVRVADRARHAAPRGEVLENQHQHQCDNAPQSEVSSHLFLSVHC